MSFLLALALIVKVLVNHGMVSSAISNILPAETLPRIVMEGMCLCLLLMITCSFHLFKLRMNCRGPGFLVSDFESNLIIGRTQFEGAKTIMGQSLEVVSGSVKNVHTYLNM